MLKNTDYCSMRFQLIKSGDRDRAPKLERKNTKCFQCRRTITPHSNYSVINGKPYCEKCAKKKKDWDFLFLMDLLDD